MSNGLLYVVVIAIITVLTFVGGVYSIRKAGSRWAGVISLFIGFWLLCVHLPYAFGQIEDRGRVYENIGIIIAALQRFSPLIMLVIGIFLLIEAWVASDTRYEVDIWHLSQHRPAAPAGAAPPAAPRQYREMGILIVGGIVALCTAYYLWQSLPNETLLRLVEVSQKHDALTGKNEFQASRSMTGRFKVMFHLPKERLGAAKDDFKRMIEDAVKNLPDDDEWKDLKVTDVTGVTYFSREAQNWDEMVIHFTGVLPADSAKGRTDEVPVTDDYREAYGQTKEVTNERANELIDQLTIEIAKMEGGFGVKSRKPASSYQEEESEKDPQSTGRGTFPTAGGFSR